MVSHLRPKLNIEETAVLWKEKEFFCIYQGPTTMVDAFC